MSEAFSYDDGGADYAPDVEEHDAPEERVEQREPQEREERQPDRRRPDANQAAARLRVEAREARERERALQERLDRLERSQSRETPRDPILAATEADWEKDPIGAGMATQAALRSYASEREQTAAQQRAQAAETQRVQSLANWADAHIEDFKESKPDFDKAVEHLSRSLTADAKAAGATDQEAAQKVARDVLSVIETSKNRGKDPAAALYAIAQRNGYKPNLDKEADVGQQNDNGRGQSPFARTGTRSGGGGVSMKSAAEAPKAGPRTILRGGDDFDKRFSALRAQAKGRS